MFFINSFNFFCPIAEFKYSIVPSILARIKYEGEVVLIILRHCCNLSGFIFEESDRCRIAPWVRLEAVLWSDWIEASAPFCIAGYGSLLLKFHNAP